MQCHYNLLYREDERELLQVCRQYDMAITPTVQSYPDASPLQTRAGGF